ncbi:uncharacterized protein RHOBADRAFT_66955 [Rhodotorula graminis WP1]|uniref:Uncharacterized protein n=1 Tax=Rhodotorula graminis (strain WP1) TaxID=578459 RepID=A0A0P9F999_RHOGW|nr:uncharacterized protein RHOBADRAFT_66955 [Rhodotorula graminis WP1]KPV72194.1 hypothetical protein RHOBADRAFT_66955 [Rhodotorula graminis WP1]
MPASPSSRFEELSDDDQAPSTPSPAPPSPAPVVPAPPEQPATSSADDGSDDDDDEEDSWWTPSELRDLLDHAQALKTRGNGEFGQSRWSFALETYREGLAELPVRRRSVKGKEKALPEGEDEGKQERTGATVARAGEVDEEAELDELSELRAILSANIAACLLKLERWKEAVSACDDALEDKADYAKAIHRRALANEAIGSWGSLTASLEDFNKLASLPGNSPILVKQIKVAQARLPKKIEDQQAKEKDEVVGKLKDLGNMVLGKFGLSTDNFKLQEQPGGGYGISFER